MVETNPQNVRESLLGLYHATMNLPAAAGHCGMTQREMKMAFREFIKYHDLCYNTPDEQLNLPL
jgi:hypothetical protein